MDQKGGETMEVKGKSKPIEIKDMFPRAKPERVESLLQSKDFQARQALVDLSSQIKRKQETGKDVTALTELLDRLYTPSMQALGDKLTKAGWTQTEQSAAHMVAQGKVKIR